MRKNKKKAIEVEGAAISILSNKSQEDYFSLTDIAKKFNVDAPADLIANWVRNKDTIEFLGVWETLHNPNFNLLEFEEVKKQAGSNRFTISPTKWISTMHAIGLVTKSGRYGGGTYGHKDIALAFCYWISPPFQLYVIKEFQRLKETEAEENKMLLDWNLRRELSKINYHIHTDAVKEHLIPPRLLNSKNQGFIFASEADVLNTALFGKNAQEWRLENPDEKGNMRDHATTEQLLVLSNLENLNAEFIQQGLSQENRLTRLNEIAIYQMRLLNNLSNMKKLDN